MPIRVRLPSGRFVSKRAYMARRRAMAKKSRPSLAKVVKKIIDRRAETKFVTTATQDNVLHNSSITGADCYRCIPIVNQGDGESQRIGDKIRPKALYVRGQLGVQDLEDNKPLLIRVLVLQLKGSRYWPAAASQWTAGAFAALLKINGEAGPENATYNGLPRDNFYPVNRDVFDVLGERFIKLNTQLSTSVEAATPGTLAKTFNIKLKGVPKILHYGSDANQYPENFAPFLSVGFAYMDGTPAPVVDQPLCVQASAHLYYTDA